MGYLELSGLTKRYAGFTAVDGVSLSVERGESVALLGPSGCGKTTTLRMLAGLIDPDEGSIRVSGSDITRMPVHKRNMGYVFQSYALFPHLNVARNVAFGLEERGNARASIDKAVREALAMVRLAGLEQRRPRELSGGQQQRVALARALVIRPSVLLLDESLSNLDAKLRDVLRHEIRDIQRTLGITTLFVTHDQVEALTMCDRVAVMEQGRIAQVGTPTEIYEKPATRFVAGFVGRGNLFPAQRGADGRFTIWGSPVPVPPTAGAGVDIFVRPERMKLVASSEPAGPDTVKVAGHVVGTSFVGDRVEVVVRGGSDERLTVEMQSGERPPAEGSAVGVLWRAQDTLSFAREAA
ncbi:MAG TPA: ABC transporter ATP-binding protein [Ramlibacter sp.]|nr:ABC transporter ATP-binding protein [Ramlibacter sp.]